MQEDKASSGPKKKINLKELRARVLSMSPKDAMDYIMGEAWYRTPRPFQFAIQVRAGANLPGILEMYIRASIANLGQIGKIFNQSEKKIAELLGVKASAVHMAAHGLKEFGIVRKGKNGEQKRQWAIEEPQKNSNKKLKPERDAMPSDPVNELCGDLVKKLPGTQSRNCDPPSHNSVTDPVKKLCPHKNKKDLKKKEENKNEGRKEKETTCLPVGDSSFKSEEEAKGILTEYDLVDPHELPHAYYSLLSKCTGAPLNASEKDIGYAIRCLDALPGSLRRPDVLSAWLTWYCLARPKKRDKTWWFTSFSGSWGDYQKQAEAIAEAAEVVEREGREVERQRQREQEEAELRAKHEAFVAQLPTRETIIAAIESVPNPDTFGYNDTVKWIMAQVAAPGLRLFMENTPYEYGYIESAYRAVKYDSQKMILQTKLFFASVALGALGQLRGDEASHELKPMKIKWEKFCDHFGLVERKARLCGFKIPKSALEYRTSRDGDQGDEADT